jgi:tetratricopeptide (TPR) repeat protein
MYGKYLISLLAIFNIYTLIFCEEVKEREISINGYYIREFSKETAVGLRAKALGDFYFNKGKYTKAIHFYENAIKYLPNEADLYFNLGNIYASQKVYPLAIHYFKLATEKYTLPENFGKTQKNFYLSLIRYAFSLEKMKDVMDNHSKAKEVVVKINSYLDEINEKFPEIKPELEKLYLLMYGTTTVIPFK